MKISVPVRNYLKWATMSAEKRQELYQNHKDWKIAHDKSLHFIDIECYVSNIPVLILKLDFEGARSSEAIVKKHYNNYFSDADILIDKGIRSIYNRETHNKIADKTMEAYIGEANWDRALTKKEQESLELFELPTGSGLIKDHIIQNSEIQSLIINPLRNWFNRTKCVDEELKISIKFKLMEYHTSGKRLIPILLGYRNVNFRIRRNISTRSDFDCCVNTLISICGNHICRVPIEILDTEAAGKTKVNWCATEYFSNIDAETTISNIYTQREYEKISKSIKKTIEEKSQSREIDIKIDKALLQCIWIPIAAWLQRGKTHKDEFLDVRAVIQINCKNGFGSDIDIFNECVSFKV